MAPRRFTDHGFSLIEVMVALAVFALGSLVLVASYLNVLNSYKAATVGVQEDEDLLFARNQLLQIADLPTAENGNEYDTPDAPLDPSRHVKWTADIVPFTGTTPTAPTDLFTVTLTLAVTTAKGTTTKTETFELLRPTWSDPTTRTATRQANVNAVLQLQGKTPVGKSP